MGSKVVRLEEHKDRLEAKLCNGEVLRIPTTDSSGLRAALEGVRCVSAHTPAAAALAPCHVLSIGRFCQQTGSVNLLVRHRYYMLHVVKSSHSTILQDVSSYMFRQVP